MGVDGTYWHGNFQKCKQHVCIGPSQILGQFSSVLTVNLCWETLLLSFWVSISSVIQRPAKEVSKCTYSKMWVYKLDMFIRQIYQRGPSPRIPPHVMASSAKLGVFRFLPTTHAKTQNKCIHDLRVLCSVLHVFIFTLRPP